MHRLFAVLSLACALSAADRWIEFRSGPFEVVTNAGPRAGRDRLLQLEQFRYGVEQLLGRSDLRPVWPIRIVVSRSGPEVAPALSRDAFTGVARPEGPLSRALLRECARILIESGPGRLPDDMEQGLADLFSTVEFKGSQMILGAPPPQAERNRNWAKMHMLGVTPDYYGKLRTLVFNLERGVDPAPAYRNAFGKSPLRSTRRRTPISAPAISRRRRCAAGRSTRRRSSRSSPSRPHGSPCFWQTQPRRARPTKPF